MFLLQTRLIHKRRPERCSIGRRPRASRLERVDDLHAVDVGSVLHVFGVEPGDSGVGTGGEQEAVPMRQAETLVEFQSMIEDDRSRDGPEIGVDDSGLVASQPIS